MARRPFAYWAIAQPGSICTSPGVRVPPRAIRPRCQRPGWTWSATREALKDAHLRLLEDIRSASEAELYGEPLAPALKWTRGRYAEAAGASHYRSAAKVLRKLKKEFSQ